MNTQTRRLMAALAVAATAAVTLTVASPVSAVGSSAKQLVVSDDDLANPDPVPGGFRTWQDLYNEQDRLNAVGSEILAAAETASGYAGIIADPTARRLDLYWQGGLPESVSRILAARSVPVTVHPARYAKAQLEAAAEPLHRLEGVTGTGASVDGSSVKVSVSTQAPASTLEALRSLAVDYVVERREVVEGAAAKQDDAPPFWGGARIRFPATGARCSSGFAMRMSDKTTRMLTAGHCTPYGWATFDNFVDGAGDTMGQVSNQNDDRDVLLIDTPAEGRMYTGNFDSGTQRAVGDSANSFFGNFVCRSSSFSNQTCNIKVTWVDASILMTAGGSTYWVSPVVEGAQVDGKNAAGNGDSGGSVFAPRADGKVNAMGTVSAIDPFWEVPCTGLPTTATRKCSWKVWYADVKKTGLYFNASVIRG